MKSFAKIIRDEREKQGFFLRQVAAALEIDQATISKFEKGDRKPSKDQVNKIADFYGVDKNELIIAWKSDLLYFDLKDEKLSNQILQVAEQKLQYAKIKLSEKV